MANIAILLLMVIESKEIKGLELELVILEKAKENFVCDINVEIGEVKKKIGDIHHGLDSAESLKRKKVADDHNDKIMDDLFVRARAGDVRALDMLTPHFLNIMDNLSSISQEIVSYFADNDFLSKDELVKFTREKEANIEYHLRELRKKDILDVSDENPKEFCIKDLVFKKFLKMRYGRKKR